jgi:hypothetical protein
MENAPKSVDGRVVEVVTPRLGGGEPVVELFFAAHNYDMAANEAVRLFIESTDEDVKIRSVGTISANTLEALGMKPGAVQRA